MSSVLCLAVLSQNLAISFSSSFGQNLWGEETFVDFATEGKPLKRKPLALISSFTLQLQLLAVHSDCKMVSE